MLLLVVAQLRSFLVDCSEVGIEVIRRKTNQLHSAAFLHSAAKVQPFANVHVEMEAIVFIPSISLSIYHASAQVA